MSVNILTFQKEETYTDQEDSLNQINQSQAQRPLIPKKFEDLGISDSFVMRLIIKHLYVRGVLSGVDIAELLKIPFPLIDSILDEILVRQYAEKKGGKGLGNSNDRFGLTEKGMSFALSLVEQDAYTGPVPITLEQYWNYIKAHNLQSVPVNETILREAWKGYVVDDSLFSLVGPAICSGKSCFLYGPPGTGKTFMAKKIADFLDRYGGQVAVPHAILAGGSVIRVYDPVHHNEVESDNESLGNHLIFNNRYDNRWVWCRRPSVIVGGELTLDMLDLRYNQSTKYYEAPLQMKANGGVLIIDDFGRQMVKPKDLLNRWIVPLEERLDYLTLHSGKKFSIPFEQLVAFATNLKPSDLLDDAFLRRIRYKIYVGEPSFEVYKHIFENECARKKIKVDMGYLKTIVEKYYRQTERPMRACDARDITDQIYDYCTFNSMPLDISNELLDQLAGAYLSECRL